MNKQIILQFVQKFLGISIPIIAIFFIIDIPLYLFNISLFNQQYLSLLWTLVTALIFLSTPFSNDKKSGKRKWYDILLVGMVFVVGLYVTIWYPKILLQLGAPSKFNFIMGILAFFLVLESVRRVAGWPIVIIVLVFVLYAKFGNIIPGILRTRYITWSRLFTQLYLGSDFMFGIPLRVAALTVFGFILFGSTIMKIGGGDFLFKLAQSLMGRYCGGPAKVSVLASSLFGSLSGSAVANVAGTGMITIPLMKKTGYSSSYAGAIEATASTGGQIVPPVMGAAAFIMAEFLGISYINIVVAALLPALLYYLGLFVQIHLQAKLLGMVRTPRHEIPSFKETLKTGWIFLIPLAVLIFVLFVLFLEPGLAALYGTATVVLVTMVPKKFRSLWSLGKLVEILMQTSRAIFELITVCAAAGFIVGLVGYTGIGLSLSRVLTNIAGGSLLILAILTAITSTILGMGMPTTAAYILLAVLAAPALINLGIEPILAHLFIFYYGALSMITPPVCLAVYAAASISEAPSQLKLAFKAMKLAIAGYVVPFIFLYEPSFALIGSFGKSISSIFLGVIAIITFAIGIEGYCLSKLKIFERLFFICVAILLLIPLWQTHLVGLTAVTLLLFTQIIKKQKIGRQSLCGSSEK